MDKPIPEAVDLLALEGAADYLAGRYSERDGWVQSIRAAIRTLTAAQQQGGVDLKEVVCLACGDYIMPMGQVCHACSHPVSAPPSAPVGQAPREAECTQEAADYFFQQGRASVLAQQPAAVDEAMAERFCRRWYEITGRSLERAHVLASLDAALAAQHQEPTT